VYSPLRGAELKGGINDILGSAKWPKKFIFLAICYILETLEDTSGMLKFGGFVTFCKDVIVFPFSQVPPYMVSP
jgi:hypothetical protein